MVDDFFNKHEKELLSNAQGAFERLTEAFCKILEYTEYEYAGGTEKFMKDLWEHSYNHMAAIILERLFYFFDPDISGIPEDECSETGESDYGDFFDVDF